MINIKKLTGGLLQISPDDNVAVSLRGDTDISAGHKVALENITAGEPVYKYGYPIGHATASIQRGDWVHGHNMVTNLQEEQEYRYRPETAAKKEPEWYPPKGQDFFQGYRRPEGKVGVRNQIWIINTVGCCNGTARLLAEKGREICRKAGVEGPYHFDHVLGCSQLGDDMATTQQILSGLVHHPNAGGVLVLGLGCENNHIDLFRKKVGAHNPERVLWLNTQDFDDEIEEGLKRLEKLAGYAASFRREKIPVSELILGLKCGGSDAFSGISANPLVGQLTDIITKAGGSALLTEVPEMFGAEEVILNRCVSAEVFHQAVEMITGFKKFFSGHGQPVYENPSPGNKEGGITTLEEKSLGCVLKGGHGPVTAVIAHGQEVSERGITLMDGPGNDLVSVTALTAAGAHLILFTTGRGTPFGGPVPTIKISSNSDLAKKKKHWIDFDAGKLLDDEVNPLEILQDFYQLVIDTASGKTRAKNEENGFREIAIFKTGVTL